MNKAKRKLRDGGTVLVFNPNFPSPSLIEYAGGLGFDVALIDCEHGTAGFERAEDLARAARAAGMTSILRPWSMERSLVTQGVRWITVHAKTMLNRGARDLFALLGQNQKH
jgi:2-keto-3-deoxy-L-rhamnonate aldolase RhmA